VSEIPSITAPGFLWAEEGEPARGMVAEVAPCIPTHRTYTFAVPEPLEDKLAIGQRVNVRLGKRGRVVAGFVLQLDRKEWDSTLRPIDGLLDDESYLPPDLVELGRRIARHYVCPLGQTLKAMTPDAVRRGRGFRGVRYARLVKPIDAIHEEGGRISPQRLTLLEFLSKRSDLVSVANLLEETGESAAVLRGMAKAGWVEIVEKEEVAHEVSFDAPRVEPGFDLNDEQAAALDHIGSAIDAKTFSVTLLFGVSGSGKTEVYVHAIRKVVAAGGQAILLVPEIVLTTQLVQRLASRFEDVAVHHSGLSEVHRSILWRQIACGEKKVIIGTRSAVFAPCQRLGLICVDEEQETSYKNLQAPRFHVRDTAIMRAEQLGIPVVLGSATPSLETWYNCERRSHYTRIDLTERVKSLPMPRVRVVDMQDEWAEQKRQVVFSRTLESGIEAALGRGEQAMLLINRRGFAPSLFCPTCKSRVTCPRCNVSLVLHTASGQAVCHYCQMRVPAPDTCPNVGCGGKLTRGGIGTQRVEEILSQRFPKARVARADSDTMKHRRHYEKIVADFEAGRLDILVGTQMIAKGLDFPSVSLVGVVDADPATLGSDYRAHERLFHLVTQVAGRAGRADASGKVVVQTTMPELPALIHALEHDFESFAKEELIARQQAELPPFCRLARVVLTHARDKTARDEAELLADRIKSAANSLGLAGVEVLGPNPCILSRIRGRYRHDLLIRTPTAAEMHKLNDQLTQDNAYRTKAETVIVDIDPVSMM